MLYPEPESDVDRERLGWVVLSASANVYARFGAETLVVSGLLDTASIPRYTDAQAGYPLAFVRLSVDDAELKRRQEARGAYAEPWAEVLAEARAYEQAPLNHPVVAAEARLPSEVAESVLEAASPTRHIGLATDQVKSAGLARAAGKAVLIGGTRAVGKSSVAWELFMEMRRRGTATGIFWTFVKLASSGRTEER